MADKTVTVKPSGGTYTTLQAALTGEFALNPNLVTSTEILTIECYAMQDTTHAVMPNFTTDSTHYVKITVPISERHNGRRSTSAYRLETAAVNEALWLGGSGANGFTRIEGLQVKNTGGKGIDGQAANVRISDCLVYDCANHGIDIDQATAIVNTISVHHSGTGAGFHDKGNSVTITLENCVAANNAGAGFSAVTGMTPKNCYSGGNTGADYSTNNTLTTSYSEDGTQSSPTAAWSTSSGGFFANVTAGTEDVSIAAGSTLKDAGTDLSADPGWIEPLGNVDIIRTARPQGASWDVGAFELAAPSGVSRPFQAIPFFS